ncbi:hypothetical protein H6503_00895 [Candidatus Woesearchaeota archaeon]|nr:hypothetical protein [Candidatus Woesearchaeota archaeon]
MADDEISIDFSKLFKKKSKKKNSEHEKTDEKETDGESRQKSSRDDENISINFGSMFAWMKKYWHIIALIMIIVFVIHMRDQATTAPITDKWASDTYSNYLQNQIVNQINTQNPNLPSQQKQLLAEQQLQQILKNDKDAIDEQIKVLSSQYKDAISYQYNGKRYIFLGDIDSYFWLRFARNIVDHGNICDEIKNGVCYDNLANAPLGRPDVPNIHPYMIATTYKVAQFFGQDIPLMHAAMITPTIVAIFVVIAAFFVGLLLVGKLGGVITALLISSNVMYVQRSLGSDNDIYTLLFPLIILAFLFWGINAKSIKQKIAGAALSGLFVGFFKFAWEHGWWNIFVMILYSFIIYLGFVAVQQIFIHKNIKAVLQNKNFKMTVMILVVFYVAGLVGYMMVGSITNAGVEGYVDAPLGPLQFAKFQKAAVNMNMWPNVITTVAEFNPLALSRIPQQLFPSAYFGNISQLDADKKANMLNYLFLLGIIGILLVMSEAIQTKSRNKWILPISAIIALVFALPRMMQQVPVFMYLFLLGVVSFSYLAFIIFRKIKIDEDKQHHIFTGIILTLWFLATLYATTKGVRFALIVVPSISIAIGCCIELIYKKVIELFSDSYEGKSILSIKAVLIIILLLIPVGAAMDSYKVSESFIPNYNAAWDTALGNIKDNSQEDAIVNSWWDFGHWFKYRTERGVTLDGATQNGPQLHWLGKLLMTDDEKVSRGILRMLDCGANTAFDIVVNTTEDVPVAVDIINEIIVEDDTEKVREILSEYGISEYDIGRILENSHCDAPENFLITSNDMISKAGVWAHFGSWNFYKAEIAQMNLVGMSRDEIVQNLTSRKYRNMTENEIDKMYNELSRLTSDEAVNAWIAPWPSFYGDSTCVRSGEEFTCDNGIVFNIDAKDCSVNTSNGMLHPTKCSYVDGNEIVIKEYQDNLLMLDGREIGAMLWPQSDNVWTLSFMHPNLVGSMFIRLYWMQGHGLKSFDKFDEQRSPLGSVIYTWKVDWEGKSENSVYGTSEDAS